MDTLAQVGGNKSEAARRLGINRKTLLAKLGDGKERYVWRGRRGKRERQKDSKILVARTEPVRLIYANPTFLACQRQNPVFNAHVLEYAALKNRIFPCQARKMRILQIRPTPAIVSALLRRV